MPCRELVKDIVEHIPVDSASGEDKLHVALLESDFGKMIEVANELDIWLAAHLTDVLEPLNILKFPELEYVSLSRVPFCAQ